MKPASSTWRVIVYILPFLFASVSLLPPAPAAEDVIVSYDFEDGDLDDFYNPTGLQAIDTCGGDIYPGGEATEDLGEVLLTNDDFAGLTVFGLRPEVVAEKFAAYPEGRDYTARIRVTLETTNEIALMVRSRVGYREAQDQLDTSLERGYMVALVAAGAHMSYPDGALGMGELTACHELVEHPEWPGGKEEGFALVDPGVPILLGESYWLEITVQGSDETGPVLMAARAWLDGDDPPLGHQIVAVDPDGLGHTAATLDPEADWEIFVGTSLNLAQQPSTIARMDDLSVTAVSGCETPPIRVTRRLWDGTLLVEGRPTSVYEGGEEYEISLELSDPRAEGECPAPTGVRIVEAIPGGWDFVSASDGGVEDNGFIVWELSSVEVPGPLTYRLTAPADGGASFSGEVTEAGGSRLFIVEGDAAAASATAVAPISDFGSIQHWLILGPFLRTGGAAPGELQITWDYLTDGTVTQKDIQPRAGDTIEPDYGGAAHSTGLAPNSMGRNPGDVPTWVEWRDLDDADDRIDFESVYGGADDVMCYAFTYIQALEDVVVNFGVSSDDSVQVVLDGREIDRNNAGRSALDRVYQDTPFTKASLGNIELKEGIHTLMVKVFEGTGEHNFRVGFLDDIGIEIPGGPGEIVILLEPPSVTEPTFRRGDADGNGALEITDPILTLGYLFLGEGNDIACLDSADADDNGSLELTDAVYSLGYQFLGGENPAPPPPGDVNCGPDPTPDLDGVDLGCVEYTCEAP